MTPLLPRPAYGARHRRPAAAGQGRGADPDRLVQGPRRGGRRVAGRRAGRHRDRDAHQRQRRRRLGGLRRAGRDAARSIAMPVDAPVITRRECVVAGAELYLVDGLIGDAGRLVAGGGRRARTATRTPPRCASRTGSRARRRWATRSPSSSAGGCPTSSSTRPAAGSGIIGIHKALLRAAGAGLDHRRPAAAGRRAGRRLRADRARRSTPGATRARPPADAHTVAFGITVPKALGDLLVLEAVRATDGTAVAVTDEELLAAQGGAGARRGRVDLPGGRGLRGGGRAAARVGVAAPATRRWSCSTRAPA